MTYLSLIVMAVGLLLYIVFGHDDARVVRISKIGFAMFWTGLLAFLLGH